MDEEGLSRKERERRHAVARQKAEADRVAKAEARVRENNGKAANITTVLVWDKTTGSASEVPSIDARHVRRLGFVASLPGDGRGGTAMELQAAALHELLVADYHIFWSHVTYDEELRRFLDSYLRFCPRAYDDEFQPYSAGGRDARALVFQRVLRVLVRASMARESKEFFVEPVWFEAWVRSAGSWFDVPRLLDVCALYLEANRKLLHGMLQSVFEANGSKLVEALRKAIGVMVKTCDKALGGGGAAAARAEGAE
jgi:hypothetical protein